MAERVGEIRLEWVQVGRWVVVGDPMTMKDSLELLLVGSGPHRGAGKTVQLQRTVFKVVFAWKPTPLADRKPWPVELPKPGEGAPLESGNPNP